MDSKGIMLFVVILLIGLIGGFFLNDLFYKFSSGGKAGQSDAKTGEYMRGEIPLKTGKWVDAYYMSRDCDPNRPIQITTQNRRLYYICVKR